MKRPPLVRFYPTTIHGQILDTLKYLLPKTKHITDSILDININFRFCSAIILY